MLFINVNSFSPLPTQKLIHLPLSNTLQIHLLGAVTSLLAQLTVLPPTTVPSTRWHDTRRYLEIRKYHAQVSHRARLPSDPKQLSETGCVYYCYYFRSQRHSFARGSREALVIWCNPASWFTNTAESTTATKHGTGTGCTSTRENTPTLAEKACWALLAQIPAHFAHVGITTHSKGEKSLLHHYTRAAEALLLEQGFLFTSLDVSFFSLHFRHFSVRLFFA